MCARLPGVDRREDRGAELAPFPLAQVGGTVQRPLLRTRRSRPIGRNHLRLGQTRVGGEPHLANKETTIQQTKDKRHVNPHFVG